MAFQNCSNLAAMFFEQVANFGDKPFLWAKRDGKYTPLSWGDVAARVTPLARGLLQTGIEPGDRVVLVSENRPAWLIADMAIMSIGAITVPAYTTNTIEDHRHILMDSGAKGVVISNRKLAQNLIPAAEACESTKFVVALYPPEDQTARGIDVYPLQKLIDMGSAGHINIVELARTWSKDQTACIIYTSGTGGTPKGVMLSHRALFHNITGAIDVLVELGLGDEVFLSFLPLSHSYEHMAGQFVPMAIGAEIYYAEGIESLAKNMLETKPTIMTAVPRLYETLHQRITTGVRKGGGTKEKIFNKARELGARKFEEPDSLSVLDKLQDRILDLLVRDKVRARFGGRLKALVSGGAPLNSEIAMFFTSLGLTVLQGYGQTETAPLISVNRKSNLKLHTVGPPVINTEVKIAEDGEILVNGELTMQGYWNNPAATAEVLKEGWIHTGDIGHIDADGHLVITDRKKDIIVNSGGDNISPQRIEGVLCMELEISQALVFGDKRPHLTALIVPDENWLRSWTQSEGKPEELSKLTDDADLNQALVPAIERINAKLSPIERIRRFTFAKEPFSIENEQMTPTMKVRRHKVLKIYQTRLENLYS